MSPDKALVSQHPTFADTYIAASRDRQWHSGGSPASNGFSLADILGRGWDFLDYARRLGAPLSGAIGAQGQAPKFLLRRDAKGHYHADLDLPDRLTTGCVLVKFARKEIPQDELIIEAERAYSRVANALGFHVQDVLEVEGALVAKRFDRGFEEGRVERFGLESLASAYGSIQFGENIRMEKLCRTVLEHSSEPLSDLVEFLARDALNIALRNTDNHARNTAFLKTPDGDVRLAPLYDLAPMYLDPQGISRICSFSGETLAGGMNAFPDYLGEFDAATKATYGSPGRKRAAPRKRRNESHPTAPELRTARDALASRLRAFEALPTVMRDAGVPERVRGDCESKQTELLDWFGRCV